MSEIEFPETYQKLMLQINLLRSSTSRFDATICNLSGQDKTQDVAMSTTNAAKCLIVCASAYLGGHFSRSEVEREYGMFDQQDFSAIDNLSPLPKAGEAFKQQVQVMAQAVLDARAPLVDKASAVITGYQHHALMNFVLEGMSPWVEGQSIYTDPSHQLRGALANVAMGEEVPLHTLALGIHNLQAFRDAIPKRPLSDRKAADAAAAHLIPLGQSVLNAALDRVKMPGLN